MLGKFAMNPVLADSLAAGGAGVGIGALLASLTAAYPRYIDTEFTPKSVNKVVPKRILPQPVFVDEDMARRLAAKGIHVGKQHDPKPATAGDEDAGIDPMQKVSDDISAAIVGGAKALAPIAVGVGAMGGTYYGVNKLIAARAKSQAKDKYIAKRKELNALLASMNNGANGDLQKVAFGLADALPYLIGVPFIAGGVMAAGDGYQSAIDNNKNIKVVQDLDKFYADLPDTPKLQMTPILRNKKKKHALDLPHPELKPNGGDMAKVAAFKMPPAQKLFSEPGKANDIMSLILGAGSAVPATMMSNSIDDPTYKWAERVLTPLGVMGAVNRRFMGKTPVNTSMKIGVGGELGLFGGLRALDVGTNRLPKAIEGISNATQGAADTSAKSEAAGRVAQDAANTKLLHWGAGTLAAGGGIGLLSQYFSNQQARREATLGRRAQSRQLKRIMSTVEGHRGSEIPGDVDGDGDVDQADKEALAAAAGTVAEPLRTAPRRAGR